MKMNRLKRFFASVVIGALIGAMCGPAVGTVNAAEVTDATTTSEDDANLTEEEKQQKEYEKKLKETYELPVQSNELTGWPQAVGTYGDAAIVMDAESGAILYAKNIDKQEYPASITKLLTVLLVYEYEAMELNVEITAESQACLGAGYASIGLDPGNVISMEQAMHAMLLASSNDVAYAIGEAVAKSQGEDYEWFLEQMNQKCKALGGVNSNFVNANGVFDENHYSCALDMALIGKALFAYPEFFEICQTLQYTIPESDTTEEHVFQQKHEMLLPTDSDYYEYAIGGKTGYTTEAQNTLVTMADDGERKLVCVVLYTYPGYVYTDTTALLEYGFNNFESVSLSGDSSLKRINDFPESAFATLPSGISLDDLEQSIEVNKTSGTTVVNYLYEDMTVASYDVGVQQLTGLDTEFQEAMVDNQQDDTESEKLSKQIVIAIIAVLLVIIFILVRIKIKRERQRKERMRRRRAAAKRRQMERKRMESGNDVRCQQPMRDDVRRKQSPRDRRPQNRRYD